MMERQAKKFCRFFLTANLGSCAVIEITLLLFFLFYDNWLAAASDTVLLGTLMWIIRLLSSGWISSSCLRHSHSFWSRSARCRSRFWKKKTRLKTLPTFKAVQLHKDWLFNAVILLHKRNYKCVTSFLFKKLCVWVFQIMKYKYLRSFLSFS